MSNTYNGWTNYATWRVHLEMFDGGEYENWKPEDFQIAAEEFIADRANGLALCYAMAFMDEVNWHQIAEAFQEENEE